MLLQFYTNTFHVQGPKSKACSGNNLIHTSMKKHCTHCSLGEKSYSRVSAKCTANDIYMLSLAYSSFIASLCNPCSIFLGVGKTLAPATVRHPAGAELHNTHLHKDDAEFLSLDSKAYACKRLDPRGHGLQRCHFSSF